MDMRVEEIFRQQIQGDTSYQESGGLLGVLFSPKYTKTDMREAWHMGIKHGIELGLNEASLKGQKIQVNGNIENDRQREFYTKFLKLAEQYNCCIQYHPKYGMCVMDLKPER